MNGFNFLRCVSPAINCLSVASGRFSARVSLTDSLAPRRSHLTELIKTPSQRYISIKGLIVKVSSTNSCLFVSMACSFTEHVIVETTSPNEPYHSLNIYTVNNKHKFIMLSLHKS